LKKRNYNSDLYLFLSIAILLTITCICYTKISHAQNSRSFQTYYISPSGDDSSAGAIDSPWKTFERAFDPLQEKYIRGGDTLYMRGGSYRIDEGKLGRNGGGIDDRQITGTAGRPTVIAGYPGERPVLYLSARIDSGWQRYPADGKNIWYFPWKDFVHDNYPWIFENSRGTSGDKAWKSVPQVVAIDGSNPRLLQEVNSEKNGYYPSWQTPPIPLLESVRNNHDDMIAGDFYYEREINNDAEGYLLVWLPDGSDPNGKAIEVNLSRYIYFGIQSYVNFENFDMRYGGYSNFVLNGDHINLKNVNMSWAGFIALSGVCDSCTVKDSIFKYNGNGAGGLQGNNMIYDNNLFEENNYRLYKKWWHCGDIKVIGENRRNMTFINNRFKNVYGDCISLWLDTVDGGYKIEKNTFSYPRSTNGVYVELSNASANDPIVIKNNIFNHADVAIAGSNFVYVLNNIFYKGGVGVHWLEANRLSASNNKILNNIIYVRTASNESHSPLFIVQDPPAPYKAENNISDYNIFVEPQGNNSTFGGTFSWESPYTFADWQVKGYDLHSRFIDPMLRNPQNGDFTPLAGSPVIDAGTNISYVTDDRQGNTRPKDGDGDGVSTIDIGAFELPTVIRSVPDPILPALDTRAPFINAIYISEITSTSANISWTTDENSDAQVEYGKTTAYGETSARDSTMKRDHERRLRGLTPGSTYHIRIRSKDSANNEAITPNQTFVTLVTPPTPPPTIIPPPPPIVNNPRPPVSNLNPPPIISTFIPNYSLPKPTTPKSVIITKRFLNPIEFVPVSEPDQKEESIDIQNKSFFSKMKDIIIYVTDRVLSGALKVIGK